MEIQATHPGDRDSDEAIGQIGLPSRLRYNYFVRMAIEETRAPEYRKIWATLALAEATLIGNER